MQCYQLDVISAFFSFISEPLLTRYLLRQYLCHDEENRRQRFRDIVEKHEHTQTNHDFEAKSQYEYGVSNIHTSLFCIGRERHNRTADCSRMCDVYLQIAQ